MFFLAFLSRLQPECISQQVQREHIQIYKQIVIT
uniref:Uncharacterized protein n=1 Tax=Arundo donax TaxID=35708 RepID=A0A0A9ASK0_ARUDO